MKKFLISFLLATLIMMPNEIFAADYETPHEFSAGDTLSADMMNELFDYIKEKNSSMTIDKVIGYWDCEKYAGSNYSNWTSAYSHYSYVGSDNLWRSIKLELQIKDDGDDTFSWSSATYNAFHLDYNQNDICDGSGQISLYFDKFTINGNKCNGSTFTNYFSVKIISKNRIIIEQVGSTNSPSLMCDKKNLPPTTPATFTASASGKTVSLAWTDNSTDETGFKVLRKDSLTGSYSTITTTSADATSYSDTVTAAGSYWYRVSATNTNGDSVASKMVKVDVE